MKFKTLFFLIVSTFLSIYLTLRAAYVPIVHDEAASFFHYIFQGDFFDSIALSDANNHLLNSILGRISYLVFGKGVFSLRLPNLLAFIGYLYGAWLISNRIKSTWISILFIVVMCFSHGFLEFFALERGYGMSMGFLILAIFQLIKFIEENGNLKNLAFALLLLSLALFANLTLLPTFILFLLYIILYLIANQQVYTTIAKKFCVLLLLIYSTLIVLIFVNLGMHFLSNGALYYGAGEGLYSVTIESLAELITPGFEKILLPIVVGLFLIGMLSFSLRFFTLKGKIFNEFTFVFPFLLIGNLTIEILLHTLLAVNFNADRTAIYLFPIFVFFVFFSISNSKISHIKYSLLTLLILPIHFLLSMNVSYSSLWISENIPQQTIRKTFDYARTQFEKPTLNAYTTHQLIWQYYSLINQLPIQPINALSYPNVKDDLVYSRHNEFDLFKNDYEIMDSNSVNGSVLWKRKKMLNFDLQKYYPQIIQAEKSSDEYFDFLIDSNSIICPNHSYKFRIIIHLESRQSFSNCVLVVNTFDSLNRSLEYNYVELDWNKITKNKRQTYDLTLSVPSISKNTFYTKIYLWNRLKQEISFKENSFYIYKNK